MSFISFEILGKTKAGLAKPGSLVKISEQICMLLILFCIVPSAFSRESNEIKLAAFEYPPFFLKQSSEIKGIGVDLGHALFGRLGFDTKLNLYPFNRSLMYLKNGLVDGIMTIVKTESRKKFLIYSRPVVPAKGYIYSVADREEGAVHFECFEDLRFYKVGVTLGYSYGSAMDEFLRSMDTDSAPSEYHSFKKLMLHRVDIVPAVDIIFKSWIKKHAEFKGKFIRSDRPFHESAYYIGISKKSRLANMMPLINETITEMAEAGVIDAIIRKHTE